MLAGFTLVLIFILTSDGVAKADSAESRAREIFLRLTGTPIQSSDTRLATMTSLIAGGKLQEAAAIATSDRNFYNVTLRDWASLMDGREETILNPLTDYQALLIGAVRDGRDFRTALTGSYTYSSKNGLTFPVMESQNSPLNTELTAVSQVTGSNPKPVGVFTTFGWASAHYNGGTNRRAVEYTFRQFLCTPISVWKDAGLPDDRIRRDVDRAPSGNAANFQNLCRNCHSGMDALAGAFAHYDFDGASLVYLGNEVASKYSRNSMTYPEGYQTQDSSFINYSTQHHNTSFGWRGAIDGSGLAEFATMISNSSGFSKCMVTRAFKEVCHRDPGQSDTQTLGQIINDFEAGGYNMKSAFEVIATSPACANNP